MGLHATSSGSGRGTKGFEIDRRRLGILGGLLEYCRGRTTLVLAFG